MSKYQYFQANDTGRDFICADIHGHFSLLEEQLGILGFDPDIDRVFSLGDLIDRGNECERSLEFLAQPWFHAILGNHECMLLEACQLQNADAYQRWYMWGGSWAAGLDRHELQIYYDELIRLPIAIELELSDKSHIALVHAEIPLQYDWPYLRARLSAISPTDFDLFDPFIMPLLWTKELLSNYQDSQQAITPVKGITHVFHGHHIVDLEPVTVTNRTYMDLGSYQSGQIGLLNPNDYLAQLQADK